ncbi:unnamed protein product, partial [Prorocentrum cordatum]
SGRGGPAGGRGRGPLSPRPAAWQGPLRRQACAPRATGARAMAVAENRPKVVEIRRVVGVASTPARIQDFQTSAGAAEASGLAGAARPGALPPRCETFLEASPAGAPLSSPGQDRAAGGPGPPRPRHDGREAPRPRRGPCWPPASVCGAGGPHLALARPRLRRWRQGALLERDLHHVDERRGARGALGGRSGAELRPRRAPGRPAGAHQARPRRGQRAAARGLHRRLRGALALRQRPGRRERGARAWLASRARGRGHHGRRPARRAGPGRWREAGRADERGLRGR